MRLPAPTMFRPTALHLRVTATQDRRNATLEAGTSRRPATHEMNARAHHRIRSGTYAREHFPMTANAALMGAEGWRLRYQIPRTPHGRRRRLIPTRRCTTMYHDVLVDPRIYLDSFTWRRTGDPNTRDVASGS
jgi:hypothetical protein